MKYLLLLLPVMWALGLAGQSTPNFCDDPNWDWTIQDDKNWLADRENGINSLGSPFDNQTSREPILYNIVDSKDYTSEKGWQLVLKDFGCRAQTDWPYFVLYNKYTGFLRIFVWAQTVDLENGAVVDVSWNPTFQKMLALPSAFGMEYAAETAKAQGIFGGNIVHTVRANFVQKGWFMVDQPLQFDPTVNPSNPTACAGSYVLHISRAASMQSNFDLSGAFEFKTEPDYDQIGDFSAIYSQRTAAPLEEGKPALYKFAIDAQSMLKKIPSKDELVKFNGKIHAYAEKGMGNINNSLKPYTYFSPDGTPMLPESKVMETIKKHQFMEKLVGLSDDNGLFRQIVNKVSDGVPIAKLGIETALGLYDYFSDKGTVEQRLQINPVMAMPTISTGSIKLKGTLTTTAPKKSIMLQVPGTKQFPRGGKSLYNAPVGVIALEKEPQLQIRKWISTYEPFHFFGGYIPNHAACEQGDVLITLPKKEEWKFKSVRIASPPIFALNKHAGLRIKESKAMIVGRIRNKPNTTLPAYEIQEVPIPNFSVANFSSNVSGIGYSLIRKDPILSYLEQGAYAINKLEEDGRIEFSTKMVDITEIVGTSITVREETDILLKILYTLEPTDAGADPTPVILWRTYKLTQEAETDAGIDEPFSFTNEQLRNATGRFEAWNYGAGDKEGRWFQNMNETQYVCPRVFIDKAHFDRNNAFGVLFVPNPQPITLSSKITLTDNQMYESNISIDLQPGFEVSGNSTFQFSAEIKNEKKLPVPAQITPRDQMFFQRDCKCPESDYKSDRNPDEPAEAKTLPFQFSVHPNPASREIALSISGGDAHITISDMSGRSCMEWDAQAGNTTADVSALAQGVYIIQAVSAKGSASTRLIKQ